MHLQFRPEGWDPRLVRTRALGIVGALVATYLGKAMGWYQPGESAGLIGATLGAILVLFLYHLIRRKPAAAA